MSFCILSTRDLRVRMRRIPTVRCSFHSFTRVGPGRARRVCRNTFAELYLAWGEGVTFAA
eukprot:1034015-Prymnesium_polylepis.1